MGEMADYAREQELEQHMNPDKYYLQLDTDPEWTTNDGRKIKVSDMDDDHIINCIKFVRRSKSNPDSIREWETVFLEELKRRYS